MSSKHRSESYEPCRCGADCLYDDRATEQEPCWGPVHARDEAGDDWLHYCEGHSSVDAGEPYKVEGKAE